MDSDSPWRSSLQQLRRNRAAMVALGVLIFMVVVMLLAPVYAHDIAHDNPFASNLQGRIKIGNHYRSVMQANTPGSRSGCHADRSDVALLQVLPRRRRTRP